MRCLQETFLCLVGEAVRLQGQLQLPFSHTPILYATKALLIARDSPDNVEEVRTSACAEVNASQRESNGVFSPCRFLNKLIRLYLISFRVRVA
jgi:hypothetical protein